MYWSSNVSKYLRVIQIWIMPLELIISIFIINLICGVEVNSSEESYQDSTEKLRQIDSNSDCGESLHGTYGKIVYPIDRRTKYSSDAHCEWIISGPKGSAIELRFTEFDTEQYYDELYISENNEITETYSGRYHPELFTSNSNNVKLTFISDWILNKGGFVIEWEIIFPNCGELLHGTYGKIVYPIDGRTKYSSGAHCEWIISGPKGSAIELRFTEFDTEQYYDRLYISENNEITETYSGLHHTELYTSNSNSVTLTFISDWILNYGGFVIEWERIFPNVDQTPFNSQCPQMAPILCMDPSPRLCGENEPQIEKILCMDPSPILCWPNDTCTEGHTCCNTHCGKGCIPIESLNNLPVTCNNEDPCEDGTLCCKTPCGKRCVKNENKETNDETSMSCPPVDPPFKLIHLLCTPIQNACSNDSDCAEGTWCCESMCGKMCRTPIPRNDCPQIYIHSNITCMQDIEGFEDTPNCENDSECGRKTCCKYADAASACGKICI